MRGTRKLILTTPFMIACLSAQTYIAVLPLSNLGVSSHEAAALTDRLRSELFSTGRFRVLERNLMQQILREQDFQLTGCTTDECAVQVGQLLGVQQMVGGSISLVGETFTTSIRLIDVETGEIVKVATYDYKGPIDELLSRGMGIIAANMAFESELMGKIPEKGSFLLVSSNPQGAKVFIDGTQKGNAPANLPVKGAGEYTVRVSISGYEEWVQKVMVGEDETVFVNAILAEEKGGGFNVRKHGPLVLGGGSALAAALFRIKANQFYDEAKSAQDLDSWHQANANTERYDQLCYTMAGVSTLAFGYSLYQYIMEKRGKTLGFRSHTGENRLTSLPNQREEEKRPVMGGK
ncbi:MAG: PEGA domain-containing protein [Fidelibacterota bacterium]|nr:MAG: PEGA domain-containing protein [Candidatus Neomarinimicrobiota bacterium]